MRVLRQLATNAAHPSKTAEALSLREEGFAFLTCGKGGGPRRFAAVDEPHRGRAVAASHIEKETDHEQQANPHRL
jgi:hypothetical protein